MSSAQVYTVYIIIYIIYILYVTPTSTPNSRLYSIGHILCLFLLNATGDLNRWAMPLCFHSMFESQRRRHARLVSVGAGTPGGRDAGAGAAIPPPALAPASPGAAPALHHDYGQIHILCYALRC